MKKVLLFAVVFSCSMWANAQRVTWATEAGLSAIQRTGYGECWRPSTRLGISADYNVNNMFSMKSGLYYTFRGYSVNNGGTYSNGDATWIENVSQTRHFLQVPILAKFSIHSNNSTKFFFEIGPYIGYCIKNHIDSNPYYLTMPSSGWIEGYPGVEESAEGGSNQFLYQHARNFDWGMASAVGLENRRWTVKLQYEMSLGKESKNDNIGVNYNSLTLSVGYKLNVKQ